MIIKSMHYYIKFDTRSPVIKKKREVVVFSIERQNASITKLRVYTMYSYHFYTYYIVYIPFKNNRPIILC